MITFILLCVYQKIGCEFAHAYTCEHIYVRMLHWTLYLGYFLVNASLVTRLYLAHSLCSVHGTEGISLSPLAAQLCRVRLLELPGRRLHRDTCDCQMTTEARYVKGRCGSGVIFTVGPSRQGQVTVYLPQVSSHEQKGRACSPVYP